jgi:hypothetical protein
MDSDITPRRSLLSPLEIRARLAELESLGFPATETKAFAEGLISFCCGEVAELALARLVARIPADDIVTMAKTQIAFPRTPLYGPDYLSSPQLLAIELAARGFRVSGAREWYVALPDGTSVNAFLAEDPNDGKAVQLCRLAVLAIALREMRMPRPSEPPAF